MNQAIVDRGGARGVARAMLLCAAWASTLGLVACAGRSPGVNRPVVAQSAAESAAVVAASSASQHELNFFDELESHPLVAHDDALEAALLLGTGKGGKDFDQRTAAAVQLGYVDSGYNRLPREAATVGEVSQILARVVRGGEKVSVDQAMADMVGRGTLPPSAMAYQGLTGAQLVSMVGGSRDAMRSAGVHRAPMPAVEPSASPGAPVPTSAEPASPENEAVNAAGEPSAAAPGQSDWSIDGVTITPKAVPAAAVREQGAGGGAGENVGDVAGAAGTPRSPELEDVSEAVMAERMAVPSPAASKAPASAVKGRPEPLPDVALEKETASEPVAAALARPLGTAAPGAQAPAKELEIPVALVVPPQTAPPADQGALPPDSARQTNAALSSVPAPAASDGAIPALPAATAADAPVAGGAEAAPVATPAKRKSGGWVAPKSLRKTEEPSKATGGSKN